MYIAPCGLRFDFLMSFVASGIKKEVRGFIPQIQFKIRHERPTEWENELWTEY